jgi:hypothetical protein
MDRLCREIDELAQIFDVADRGQVLIGDFMARETRMRNRVSGRSPVADARLGKHHRDEPGRVHRGRPGSQAMGIR